MAGPARPANESNVVPAVLVLRLPGPMDTSVEDALQSDFEVRTLVFDQARGVESVAGDSFDIIVLQVTRDDSDTVTMLRALRKSQPSAGLLVVAPDLADDTVLEALRLDVNGLVMGPLSADAVAHCVRQVRDGHLCLDQRLVRRAVKRLAERQIAAREAARLLTPRELEIARLVGRGLTNKEIAAALFVTEGTIKVHVHNVFEKLGLRNRKALAVYARENGLV